MANVDAAFGMRPVRHLSGHPWNGMTMRCFVNHATVLYPGMCVTLVAAADTTGLAPSVVAASAGDTNKIFGVFTGKYSPTADEEIYTTASTATYINVCVDPSVIYQIQCDGTLAYTEVNQQGNLASNGGSTVTGISTGELSATAGVEPSYQLWILQLADLPLNDISADNSVWEVMINMHWLNSNTSDEGGFGISA